MLSRTARRATETILRGLGMLALGASAAVADPVTVDQGPNWTTATRTEFYSQDQGSQMMPLSWLKALKQSGGKPFLAGSLGRYGYLPNPASPTPGLPVGFTVNGTGASTMVGMTCAACHTRQIEAGGSAYRIDGGPAIVDFQSMLQDLDTSVGGVLADDTAFRRFAVSVLGPKPTKDAKAALKSALQLWFLRYDTLMKLALPTPPWGPARLDAVSMIFNRLSGLDLGPAPSFLIPGNIHQAAAPVRYPFLWNAAIQDHTQWPGFANNGDAILSLARNLGEVFGVFATFQPTKSWYGTDFLDNNSADFPGLFKLGGLMRKIGPPVWPWSVNSKLASQGMAVFNRATADGGCVECHGITPGTPRFLDQKTWATPVLNVGTDTREYDVLALTADTGVLNGATTLLDRTPLKPIDATVAILGTSILGSIEQYCIANPITCATNFLLPDGPGGRPPAASILQDIAQELPLFQAQTSGAYESRVLQGIWAAAPYLHNGSVPSLAQLLTPPAQRVASFAVGPKYDRNAIGLAATQTKFNYVFQATGCDNLNSGNSNCGHDYGTSLSDTDKAALLEYLKTL